MKTKLKYLAILLLATSSPLFSDHNTKTIDKLKCGIEINQLVTQLSNWEQKLLQDEILKQAMKARKIKIDYSIYDLETQTEVKKLANYFNIPVEWIYKLFYKESRLNPSALNKTSNAAGLIQFMPTTAERLGTSTEALLSMTVIEQLPYVRKYLEGINPSKKFKSFSDLYSTVFLPIARGKESSYVLGSHEGIDTIRKIAHQNSSIDLNQDNQITVAEFKQFANS
jgi:hypothetical protein